MTKPVDQGPGVRRECLAEQDSVVGDALIALGGAEQKQRGPQSLRTPSEGLGCRGVRALPPSVAGSLPLRGAPSSSPGRTTRRRPAGEGEEIDPAPTAATTDFDLVTDLPAEVRKVAADVTAAPRMDAVELAPSIGQPKKPRVERRSDPELAKDLVDEGEVEVARDA